MFSTNKNRSFVVLEAREGQGAKFFALYEEPYWRQAGLSGQAFSQQGPLGEIHDGSNKGSGPYGLTGFVNIPAAQRSREHPLTKAILVQLAVIYGNPTAISKAHWPVLEER